MHTVMFVVSPVFPSLISAHIFLLCLFFACSLELIGVTVTVQTSFLTLHVDFKKNENFCLSASFLILV